MATSTDFNRRIGGAFQFRLRHDVIDRDVVRGGLCRNERDRAGLVGDILFLRSAGRDACSRQRDRHSASRRRHGERGESMPKIGPSVRPRLPCRAIQKACSTRSARPMDRSVDGDRFDGRRHTRRNSFFRSSDAGRSDRRHDFFRGAGGIRGVSGRQFFPRRIVRAVAGALRKANDWLIGNDGGVGRHEK